MAFTQASLDFLMENRLTDSREWFKEHRADFDRLVIAPMTEIFDALTPSMLEIDPEFLCVPKMGKSFSRLWRDTRFAKEGGVFRDNMWFTYTREKYRGYPSYYFEVSPAGCQWGLGWYYTPPETMKKLREKVLEDDPLWLRADRAYRAQSVFTMAGETYKRSPYAAQSDEKRLWLDRKSLSLNSAQDFDIMFSDGLADRLREDFLSIRNVYAFLVENTVPQDW